MGGGGVVFLDFTSCFTMNVCLGSVHWKFRFDLPGHLFNHVERGYEGNQETEKVGQQRDRGGGS